jgi:hypothetical protein
MLFAILLLKIVDATMRSSFHVKLAQTLSFDVALIATMQVAPSWWQNTAVRKSVNWSSSHSAMAKSSPTTQVTIDQWQLT